MVAKAKAMLASWQTSAMSVDLEEAVEMIRSDIVALLSRDPHCPIAQLLGQALMDLYEELY